MAKNVFHIVDNIVNIDIILGLLSGWWLLFYPSGKSEFVNWNVDSVPN